MLAAHITKNHVFYKRIKHIGIDYHLIRQKLKEGIVHLVSISSSCQIVDIFTKALPTLSLLLMLKLGIQDLAPLVGEGYQTQRYQQVYLPKIVCNIRVKLHIDGCL